MNRTPVCRFYQAGSCEHDSSCTFEHPKKRCHKFTSVGWCPYGVSCHFWHDQTFRAVKPVEKREPCLFFVNGQCKYGDHCSMSHDVAVRLDKYITLDEYRAMKKKEKGPTTIGMFESAPSLSRFVSHSCRQLSPMNSNFIRITEKPDLCTERKHFEPSTPKHNRIPLSEVTEDKLRSMHQWEAERLLKTYSSDKLQESAECESGRNFCLKFSSTDPDWAYDFREVLLHIHLAPAYPTDALLVKVLNQDHLPVLLIEHLNTSISSWIQTHHQFLKTSGYVELYLRPFLKWLDRRLEDLFTEGLRKVKTDLEKNNDPIVVPVPSVSLSLSPHSASMGDVTTEGINKELSRQKDNDRSDHSLSHASSSTSKTESDVLMDLGEWIEPVVSQAESVSTNVSHDRSEQSVAHNINMPGTHAVSLEDSNFIGKTGTYLQRSLAVELHCIRCRCNFSWVFHFHGYNSVKDKCNNNQMRSIAPFTTQCARCHQSLKLICERSIVHPFNNRAATLFLHGCLAHDINMKQSSAELTCAQCNFIVKISSLDRTLSRQCFRCHSVVGMKFNKFRLDLLKSPEITSLPTSAKQNRVNSDVDGLSRKLRRAMNASQLPLIQDGMPLPDNGCCKHYKKSYRWLRFPCCGRLEPCDVCHNQNAKDGHEMEYANRMVCGFCSKEQSFSNTKPCERCGKSLTGSRTAHWEGGKGCRNQLTMSKKDTKKYASTCKTVPKGK